MLVTWVLVRGVKESAEVNTTMVAIKILAIVIFCLGAARAIHTSNWHPFAPNGFSGVLTGASIVFFTYIGFDSVSTAAEECRKPQRDMPFGIIATLIICTILYGSVSLVLTGIAHYQTLNTDSPVADALKALGYNRLRLIVTAGALMGMLSSLLVYQYGQARVWFAMSRDRLLPDMFSSVHPNYQTPLHQHLDRRLRRRHPRRHLGHRHLRRTLQHRHPLRLHRRLRRRHRPAQETARPPPHLPRPAGALRPAALHRLLPAADDGPAALNLDSLLPLAGHRPHRLHPLRRQTHRRRLGPSAREAIIETIVGGAMPNLKLTSVGTSIETAEGYLLTPYDPEVAAQLKAGREFMQEYRDSFQALAE